MRIGLFVGALELMRDVAERLRRISDAERDGFDSYWLPQHFGADMLTVIAMAGMQTQRIELGTAVVPTYPRHPVALAQQALTAQVAVGGRLTLGIGVSHRSTIEDWLGLPFAHPARHMEEYLSVLRPLLQDSGVDFQGREFRVAAELQIPDADMVSCPVVMAALGPRMLEIAGRLAEGTVTWMTGPNTLRDHVVPRLRESAEAAGNPPPRVCVGIPIAVTDGPERARARADRLFQHYAVLPSYGAMLEREGVESPGGDSHRGQRGGRGGTAETPGGVGRYRPAGHHLPGGWFPNVCNEDPRTAAELGRQDLTLHGGRNRE